MNYIVISPYYPQNFQNFTIALCEKNINVLGIGQEPYEQLDAPLREALTEYFRVENLEDVAEIKRAVAFLFYKHGPIDRIESHNEYWLELDAALREQFNVFGAKPDELLKTKSKALMKEHFIKAGVPVVPGYLIQTASDVPLAVAELGLPMIAKPDNGVGAAKTFKLESEDDVTLFLTEWDGHTPYFCEQFVSHNEVCTFDGLIDTEGNIHFATSLTYYHPPLSLILERLDNAFFIEKEVEPKLRAYGEAIVREFGMKERFFHIELFRTEDDYIAIEYNNRPAGGFAVDVYNYAHSLDLYQLYASIVAGESSFEQQPHGQYCLAVARRDEHHYVYTDQDIRSRYANELMMSSRIPFAFADLLGDTLYVLNTPSRQIVDDMVQYVGEKSK